MVSAFDEETEDLDEDREICRLRPKPILKALSWLGRIAGIERLQPILQCSLIKAFQAQSVTDRREALPLPMAVVVAWEQHVCSPHCPPDRPLFLGELLLALRAGLRLGTCKGSSSPADHSQVLAKGEFVGKLRLPRQATLCHNPLMNFRPLPKVPMGFAVPGRGPVSLGRDRKSPPEVSVPGLYPASPPQLGRPTESQLHLPQAHVL